MKIVTCKYLILRFIIFCFCEFFVIADENASEKSDLPDDIKELFDSGTARKDENKAPVGLRSNVNKIFSEGSTLTFDEGSFGYNVDLKNATDVSKMAKGQGSNHTLVANGEDHFGEMTKLNKTNSGLMQDMYDVNYVNGTSSIKPRKGVHYSTVVARKGVDIHDLDNQSLPVERTCFIAEKGKCYDVEKFKHFAECSCCKIGNAMGNLVSQQPLIDCSSCSPINVPSVNVSSPCENICCKNKSESPVTISEANEHSDHIHHNKSKSYLVYETPENTSTDFSNKNNSMNHIATDKNVIKRKKLKPSITKVPLDIETDANDSNPFSKYKGEKYVPIIVSIFILPLVGIFILFMWKKMRELWDRRYYKRMDFLIDGMYND